MSKFDVAIVVPNLKSEGGVNTVANFIYEIAQESKLLRPSLISIATSSRDKSSVSVLSPATWGLEVKVKENEWRGREYKHFGARFTELEFQRYRPRCPLTRELDSYDLIQVVAGTPAWGCVAQKATPPVALQVATLAASERPSRLDPFSSPSDLFRSFMTPIIRYLDWKAIEEANLIFVENSWMKKVLKENTKNDKTVFAPPGIDTTFFTPDQTEVDSNVSAKMKSFCDGKKYLLSVGRFGDDRKNIKLLFKAYAKLNNDVEQIPPLVLAGRSGPSENAWRYAQNNKIRDKIIFFENIPKEELAYLYKNAYLFVLSSNEEGLGIVILEAMASGLPVVSTNCGGPSTSVVDGETGLLVPPKDANALADGVRRLLDNPEKVKLMSANGRERVKAKFSVQATKKKFLTNYRRILE